MFDEIKKQMQLKFNEMTQLGTLYYVEVDRDEIWDTYLNAIPFEYRQSNNCNCCKSFLRQFGSIVGIKDNLTVTLWDFISEDVEYGAAIKALRNLESQLEIVKYVINVKQTEAEEKKNRQLVAEQREFLTKLKEKKQLEQLEGLSAEEIDKRLAALSATTG